MTAGFSKDAQALEQVFIEEYAHLTGEGVPSFSIQFFLYRTLNHTIRLRSGKILVRISDILADAPLQILTSVLVILLHKLFRRPVSGAHRSTYQQYVTSEPVRRKARRIRSLRGQKRLSSPVGQVFDLGMLFDRLNDVYFGKGLRVRHLSWSQHSNQRALGHYDAAHQTIVIDRRLDRPSVPQFVVEYVVYHEMLHAFWGDKTDKGRRRIHHELFREAEKKFFHYLEAKEFIRSSL